ncbi:MAG: acyl-CoA dehydrogenase family protein [Candidatus Thorarchaeota archaeon]|nr:MAG: acyl-CoA dehydrogenase [Candidatus Thorarchaeota archaeon]
MVNFEESDEERMFREAVRDFAQKYVAPVWQDYDRNHEIPRDLIKKMAEMQLWAPTVSEEYGGAGISWVMACIAAEELARADLSIALPVMYLVEASWAAIFDMYGTHEAKSEILPRVTKGDLFFGIATTEPTGGSDLVNSTKTIIKPKGDNFVVNGEKVYISGVKESEKYGGVYWTLGKEDPKGDHKSFTGFILPLNLGDGLHPGITTTLFEDMGRMGVSTGGFNIENVEIPKHYIIGERGRGFYYAMEGFSAARVLIGATCLGSAEGAFNIGVEYVKQRKQFGRPLAAFEGIMFEAVDSWMALEADKNLVYKAAWIMDQHYREKNPNYSKLDIAQYTAAAKYRTPHDALDVITRAMTWHGAFGYTKECPLEAAYRGVRSYTVGAEGGAHIQKIVMGREIFGKEYLPYRQKGQFD